MRIFRSTVPRQTSRSGVSVIIPVHNAALTLEATLHSVVCQTYADWEAIIIDDGSTDGTGAIADNWAQKDSRFHILHQEKSGVSAARNRGLREARYPYVLFLDGDDRIAPRHLECMVDELIRNPNLDAVHCAWQRIFPSGSVGRVHQGSAEADLFEHFAFHCHFVIHTCVLRRELALAVGGFDSASTTCEDWDFWQRVARTGARFGRVSQLLAFYCFRPDSASHQDNVRSLTDMRTVIDRGHSRDPRISIIAEEHAEGRYPILRDRALYTAVADLAAKEIGAGRHTGQLDAVDLLETWNLAPEPGLSATVIADIIQECLSLGANRSEEDWHLLWSEVRLPLKAFLANLETRTRAPALAFTVLQHLEKKTIVTNPGRSPLLEGTMYRTDIDVAKEFSDVLLPPEADRLICRLMAHGQLIGVTELPGAGAVSGLRIAEAAADGHAQTLVRRALTPPRFLSLSLRTLRGLIQRRTLRLLYYVLTTKPNDTWDAASLLRRGIAEIARSNLPSVLAGRPGLAVQRAEQHWQTQLKAAADAGRAFARAKIGPRENRGEWDRVFAVPDPWGYESEYEAIKYEQTLALLPEGVTDALEIGCAEGHFTVRLAPKVGHLTAVDISRRALARAEARCAGITNVNFQNLDLNTDDVPGPFDLIVCSEVLYYTRDLPGSVRRILSQVRPGGFFLTCHARLLADDPEGIGFDWNYPSGVETIASTITLHAGIALLRELRTPLYRILLYQRLASGQQSIPTEILECKSVGRMTPAVEEGAKSSGHRPVKLPVQRSSRVPILMYHRIATNGPHGLERYRVHPDLFSAQMTALHRAGYRTMSLGEWATAIARLVPPRGKRVVLTFDDGYRDFLTAAMPVLRAHRFSATVFLVAERIGETAAWDSAYGETAPLLSWEEVRALQDVGVEFGCHSLVHRPLTGMCLSELAEDTVRARAILEEGLACSVRTLAYPYGAESEFVRRFLGDLGFLAAVTCEAGVSQLGDDPLQLRRIEVADKCTPERLLSLIGPG